MCLKKEEVNKKTTGGDPWDPPKSHMSPRALAPVKEGNSGESQGKPILLKWEEIFPAVLFGLKRQRPNPQFPKKTIRLALGFLFPGRSLDLEPRFWEV